MTKEEEKAEENNSNLPPGPELDRLVGEKMGQKFNGTGRYYLIEEPRILRGPGGVVPSYSADIAAAWQLVGKAKELGFELALYRYDQPKEQYVVYFNDDPYSTTKRGYPGCADTAAHAICLAFLALPAEVKV